jgi:hypothetical protein
MPYAASAPTANLPRAAPWPDEAVEGRGSSVEGQHATSGPSPSTLDPRPSSVLLITAEDDLADTIRPRLEALGADCQKILSIDTWGSFSETANSDTRRDSATCRPFALHRDLARLRNLLDAIPDCRLLIIDPVSAFLGGTNEHANADVQSLLTALAALARDRDLAILVVSHLRKKEGAAIYRTMGSLAFVAAARAVWLLSKVPADPNQRYFLPLKNNLAPVVTGLAYTIEASGHAPVIRWSPDPVNITLENLLASARSPGRPDDERQHAIHWLRERLTQRPRPTREIRQEADAHGIGYGTLRRAFRDLGAEAVKQAPFGYGTWIWKLPGIDAQNPGGEFCAPFDFLGDFGDLFEPWLPRKSSTTSSTDT